MIMCQSVYAGNDHYEIKVTLKGAESDTVLLGYHYGDKQMLRDSLVLDDKGQGVFKGDSLLQHGVYLIISPTKKFFELIISDDQQFEISSDTSNLSGSVKVKGSKENEVFYDYISYLNMIRKEAESLKKQMVEETDQVKKDAMNAELQTMDAKIRDKRTEIYTKNPDFLSAAVLRANDEPIIPEPPILADGSIDSTFRVRYFREHYFDSVDFGKKGLVRSPVLHRKMTYFLDKLTYPVVDSVKNACDYLIDLGRQDEDVFKYVTMFTLNKYAASKIMGMDAVYVYLVEKYYLTGEADWVDDASLYRMTERVKTLKPILIGEPCPPLALTDRDGHVIDMLSLPEEYIVLMFWDPDCGHCKKSMPDLLKFYKEYHDQGVELYAVATEHEEEKWLKYLDGNEQPWINVADFKFRNNFREVFDVRGTPRIFVMDKERNIIAKQIGAKYLGDWLKRYREGLEKAENKEK